jgi:hypothetical protein
MQGGVEVADRCRRQPGRELLLVQPLEVLWREPAQLDPAERWDGVDTNILLVALKGAWGDGVADDSEPLG